MQVGDLLAKTQRALEAARKYLEEVVPSLPGGQRTGWQVVQQIEDLLDEIAAETAKAGGRQES